MRKKRLFKYYILYLLIYIILYVQFNFNYDSLIGFLESNILIFNKSILIQIEFFSIYIIMFLLINEYMSFYDNLKAENHVEKISYTMFSFFHLCSFAYKYKNMKRNDRKIAAQKG